MTDQIDGIERQRAIRFKEVRAQLLKASGLSEPLGPADEIRIDSAAWLWFARELMQHNLLRGIAIDTSELIRVTALISEILPPRAPKLALQFIGTLDQCPCCGYDREAAPEFEADSERDDSDDDRKPDVDSVDPVEPSPRPLPALPPPNVVAFAGAVDGISGDAP